MKNCIFRVDGSSEIGSGHVIRCLTLAKALRLQDWNCIFLCMQLPGDLREYIAAQEFFVSTMPVFDLNLDWEADAKFTSDVIRSERCSILILDHYQLDLRWELSVKRVLNKLVIIDDLANRNHVCDLLIDQNLIFGFQNRYLKKTNPDADFLLGPEFALVSPNFSELRDYSLSRRRDMALNNLLIFMGGGDTSRLMIKVVRAISKSPKKWKKIDIVVGQGYCSYQDLEQEVSFLGPGVSIHKQITNMAEIMSNADFAILSGGTITWEKCILGLPSIVIVAAENQEPIASYLGVLNCQITLAGMGDFNPEELISKLNSLNAELLSELSKNAALVCDGLGVMRVEKKIRELL